jgi:hypothetical protein
MDLPSFTDSELSDNEEYSDSSYESSYQDSDNQTPDIDQESADIDQESTRKLNREVCLSQTKLYEDKNINKTNEKKKSSIKKEDKVCFISKNTKNSITNPKKNSTSEKKHTTFLKSNKGQEKNKTNQKEQKEQKEIVKKSKDKLLPFLISPDKVAKLSKKDVILLKTSLAQINHLQKENKLFSSQISCLNKHLLSFINNA